MAQQVAALHISGLHVCVFAALFAPFGRGSGFFTCLEFGCRYLRGPIKYFVLQTAFIIAHWLFLHFWKLYFRAIPDSPWPLATCDPDGTADQK